MPLQLNAAPYSNFLNQNRRFLKQDSSLGIIKMGNNGDLFFNDQPLNGDDRAVLKDRCRKIIAQPDS